MVPILIGFLASVLNIGGIGEKIREIVAALQKPVTKALDVIIATGLKLAGRSSAASKGISAKVKAKVAAGKGVGQRQGRGRQGLGRRAGSKAGAARILDPRALDTRAGNTRSVSGAPRPEATPGARQTVREVMASAAVPRSAGASTAYSRILLEHGNDRGPNVSARGRHEEHSPRVEGVHHHRGDPRKGGQPSPPHSDFGTGRPPAMPRCREGVRRRCRGSPPRQAPARLACREGSGESTPASEDGQTCTDATSDDAAWGS